MRSTAAISPTHLSLLTLLGAGITASAFVPYSSFATAHHQKTIAYALITLGCVITIASDFCLSYGIKHNQFSPDDLERLRLNTKSALWNILRYAVAIIALVFFIIASMPDVHHSLLRVGSAAFVLSSTMAIIRSTAATKPKVQPPPTVVPTLLDHPTQNNLDTSLHAALA